MKPILTLLDGAKGVLDSLTEGLKVIGTPYSNLETGLNSSCLFFKLQFSHCVFSSKFHHQLSSRKNQHYRQKKLNSVAQSIRTGINQPCSISKY
jgi:hypothetical protein